MPSVLGFSKATKTWLPVHQNYKTLNLAKQKKESESHYKLYQTLTKLRKTSQALKNGTLRTDVLDGGSLLVLRLSTTEAVFLLINFSDDQTQKINIPTNIPGLNGTVVVSSVGSKIKWG